MDEPTALILTAAVLSVMGWFINRLVSQIDKLHDRIDEVEKEILVLQMSGGHDQTVFTPRTKRTK